jgi:hypothetical protein
MSTITTEDGTELHYKDRGERPVVTFSHGITTTHQDQINADSLAFIKG